MSPMELIKPKRLSEGDTILVVAPASSMSGLNEEAIERGINNLEALGLNVVIGPHAKMVYGHTAGSPRERAGLLMDCFTDAEIDGIMTVWGGFNSNDVIEYLIYEEIGDNPKVFIGYSDITILNTVLLEKADLVTFQGPAFVTMTHSFLMDYEVEEFRKVVMDGEAPHVLKAHPTFIDDPFYYNHPEKSPEEKPNPGWDVITPGTSEGRIIGGNLGTLLALAGTPYWPHLEGRILFLEDDEAESTASIARYFRQLRHMGVFEEIAGLLIGRCPEVVGFNDRDSLRMILEDCAGGYDFPIVSGLDFGHTNPLITIPVGIRVKINADKKQIEFLESGVR